MICSPKKGRPSSSDPPPTVVPVKQDPLVLSDAADQESWLRRSVNEIGNGAYGCEEAARRIAMAMRRDDFIGDTEDWEMYVMHLAKAAADHQEIEDRAIAMGNRLLRSAGIDEVPND